MSALKELGRDSPILLQILQEIKTDVLDVCAKNEQIKALGDRILMVEQDMSEGKHLVTDTMEPLIEQMQSFPTSLAQFQI